MLGVDNADAFGKRLLGYFAEMGIKAKKQRDFDRSVRGIRGNVLGKIFHWQVEADTELAEHVMRWAQSVVVDLNAVVRATRGTPLIELRRQRDRIVNAFGATVELPAKGRFLAPLVATNISLFRGNRKPKGFSDALTVSLYTRGSGKPSHVSLTTQGEYKFNTAIQKAAGQVDEARGRLTNATKLRFTAGGQYYEFEPHQVVFLAAKVHAVDVTRPSSVAGRPELNQYVVTNPRSLEELRRTEPLSSDPDVLLGGEGVVGPPQLTPVVAKDAKIEIVLVEVAIDARLVIHLTDVILGR